MKVEKPMVRVAGLLLITLLLAGCSQNPLMRTGKATSTDSARAIDASLEEAEKPALEQAARPVATGLPDSVADALLPSLQPEATEERFDVRARGLPAGAFFEGLVEGTAYNVVVHPEVEQSISLRLNDVSVPEVMTIAGDLFDLEIQRDGRLFRVLPGGLKARLFAIDYLNFKRQGGSNTRVSSGQVTNSRSGASGETGRTGVGSDPAGQTSNLVGTRISTRTESDFWQDVSQTLQLIVGAGDGRDVIVNASAGLVMVRAAAEELRLVEDYLKRTQLIMQRQVILEARILEIALDEGYQQGINWSEFRDVSSTIASDGMPREYIHQGLLGQVIDTTDIGGLFSASVRSGNFNAMIELLGRQGNVQILSSPRISTVNNQKAVIKVGTDEFFVTDIDFNEDSTALGASANTSTSVELTPFFSGISLDVTPQISEDGSITLHVHPSVSEVADQEKRVTVGERDVTLPLARSTVRETDSVIRARSGQIVVIGGLIQNTSEDNNAAVPFLSEIPLVGELFKQRDFQSRKSELVILLRPVVVGEDQMREDISASRERMQVLRELLQSPGSPTPEPEGSLR